MTDSDAALTRHVCYDDIVTYCARCATSLPAVAASTAARAPATVTLVFASPGALPDGLLHVTVRELSFQDGGLGFRLFPAAVWHAAWLAERFLPLLAQAGQPQGTLRVLELGAGLALCGLTVAVAAKATGVAVQVTLSDFNPGLLTAAEAACKANGVAHCTDVAFLDWVADAADGGQLSRSSNPEYFRVIGGPCPHALPSPLQLPPDAAFDVIIATEVLYESGAATALPAVILRRLDRNRGGRFCTLMAVRDTELLRTCVATLAKLTPSVLPGLQLRMCVAPASALPLPSKQQPGAEGASDAAVERSTRGDLEPLCEGQRWMSAAECDAVICGGPGGKGGPLQAAWLEALWTPDGSRMQVPGAALGPCCGRNARGLACPCARR